MGHLNAVGPQQHLNFSFKSTFKIFSSYFQVINKLGSHLSYFSVIIALTSPTIILSTQIFSSFNLPHSSLCPITFTSVKINKCTKTSIKHITLKVHRTEPSYSQNKQNNLPRQFLSLCLDAWGWTMSNQKKQATWPGTELEIMRNHVDRAQKRKKELDWKQAHLQHRPSKDWA